MRVWPEVQRPRHKPHSVLGAISLVVGLLSMLLVCGGLLAVLALDVIHGGRVDLSPFEVAVSGLCAVSSGPLALLGLGSGAVGFFERERDHVANLLGIILAVISLLILAAMLILGLAGQSQPTFQPNL